MRQFICFSIIQIFLLHFCIAEAYEKEDHWGIGFLPIIGYDDETSLTLGISSVFYFNPDPENSQQELDELELNADFSMNDRYNFSTAISKYFNGNRQKFETSFGFSGSPDDFYGIGGNTSELNQETYTSIIYPLKLSYSINVWEGFYIGPVYDFRYGDLTEVESGGMLAEGGVTGSRKMHSSGIGFKIYYNNTNSGLYKRKGFKVSFSNLFYLPVLASSSSFQTAGISYKHYIEFMDIFILGLQLLGEHCAGDVPFYYLPSLGGSEILRGYASSRYIAPNLIVAQAELRFPIWRRLSGVAFIGAGEVTDRIKDFGTNIRTAGGLGLRLTVQKKQNINIRFDIAMNDEGDTRKYIKLQEAF